MPEIEMNEWANLQGVEIPVDNVLEKLRADTTHNLRAIREAEIPMSEIRIREMGNAGRELTTVG